MKIAVLIADSFGEPFESLKSDIQPRVWDFENRPDVFYMKGIKPNRLQVGLNKFTDETRYKPWWPIQRAFDCIELRRYQGQEIKVELSGQDLSLELPEGLRYLGLKVLTSLEYLITKGYDLFYKTTLSSLVNPREFQKKISQINLNTPYYGGTLVNFGGHPFVSGANMLINRKTVEILISNKKRWNYGLLDDVAIGRLLEHHVEVSPLESLNIASVGEVSKYLTTDIENTMHFRCKSSKLPRNDVEIMRSLSERIRYE
jgi:hypothetical protein